MQMALLIALILFAWIIWRMNQKRDTEARSASPEADESTNRLKQAEHALQAAIASCQENHPHAFKALAWLAASDGTVSKQELRLIFRFCEAQGTQINRDAHEAIDLLNTGLNMSVTGSEKDVHESLSELAGKPLAYKTSFFGAAHALCGTQKRLSQAKQRFLEKAEALISA